MKLQQNQLRNTLENKSKNARDLNNNSNPQNLVNSLETIKDETIKQRNIINELGLKLTQMNDKTNNKNEAILKRKRNSDINKSNVKIPDFNPTTTSNRNHKIRKAFNKGRIYKIINHSFNNASSLHIPEQLGRNTDNSQDLMKNVRDPSISPIINSFIMPEDSINQNENPNNRKVLRCYKNSSNQDQEPSFPKFLWAKYSRVFKVGQPIN